MDLDKLKGHYTESLKRKKIFGEPLKNETVKIKIDKHTIYFMDKGSETSTQ